MTTRSTINLVLILLMLGAQIALAQHATVHFTDHGHSAQHHHDDNKEGTPQTGELCQICILNKNIAHALTPDAFIREVVVTQSAYRVPFAQNHITRQASQGYLARGPPLFLI